LISQWLDQILLTLNCKKSKFILFGSNSHLKSFTNISIHVNEHQLARERTFKYLGITFSENLTWSDHLNNISTKINQHIGLLRRIKTFIPLKTRLIIYNAFILPLFDYGDIIWGDKNNSSLMDNYEFSRIRLQRPFLMLPTYPHPLKPSTNYTGNHLPTDANHTDTNHI
jgi:hypothetical protein